VRESETDGDQRVISERERKRKRKDKTDSDK